MSELQRLKSLLPPENESWVFVEAAAAIDPPLITLEEIGRDEVEIQIDLDEWDNFAIDHRNLLFWHEVGKIQNDTIPRDGWEMAALAIGLGGAIGELWVQDGLLLLLALGLSSFAGYRLYLKNNSEKKPTHKFSRSSFITTCPSLFVRVIASLLIFPRFDEKFISAFILSHLIEFGFRSFAIVRIPRFAIGIAKGPIPQHKSTQTDFSSMSSDII